MNATHTTDAQVNRARAQLKSTRSITVPEQAELAKKTDRLEDSKRAVSPYKETHPPKHEELVVEGCLGDSLQE